MAAELAALRERDDLHLVAVGVGPVEAALGTSRALAAQPYRAVVNAGIAGGFRGRCGVGDAVVCVREDFVDLGLEGGGTFPLPDGLELERTVHVPDEMTMAIRAGEVACILGRGITSAIVTATDARAELLATRYGADVESMEGFAVLRAAERAGVPAIEIRGVSNVVGNRESSGWDFRAGAEAAVATLEAYLDVLLAG